jgi:hypothetical protein
MIIVTQERSASAGFKLSNNPKFAAKVQDVIGLYVDPPEHALVLSRSTRSRKSRRSTDPAGTADEEGSLRDHDHKRHGTTILFAALEPKIDTVHKIFDNIFSAMHARCISIW